MYVCMYVCMYIYIYIYKKQDKLGSLLLQFCFVWRSHTPRANDNNLNIGNAEKGKITTAYCARWLPLFSILRDHWGFFIRRKLCFGCRQSYHIWRVDKTCKRFCVKCCLSYTADYTGTCPKSPVIFWLIR